MRRSLRPGPVIACVDGSAHTGGVCGAAAWLAGRLGDGLELLHLDDDAPQAGSAGRSDRRDGAARRAQVIERAAGEVIQAGAELTEILTGDGAFLEAAASLSRRAGMLVVGRRGRSSPAQSRRLGAHVGSILQAAECPVCLAPQAGGAPRRALVLLDARHPAEAMTVFLAGHPSLDGLSCTAVAFGAPSPGSRSLPRPRAEHPDQALESFLREDDCDVLVLPRGAFLADPRRRDLEGLLTELDVTVLVPARGRLRVARP